MTSPRQKRVRAWAAIKDGKFMRQPGLYPNRYVIYEMQDRHPDSDRSVEVEIRILPKRKVKRG